MVKSDRKPLVLAGVTLQEIVRELPRPTQRWPGSRCSGICLAMPPKLSTSAVQRVLGEPKHSGHKASLTKGDKHSAACEG